MCLENVNKQLKQSPSLQDRSDYEHAAAATSNNTLRHARSKSNYNTTALQKESSKQSSVENTSLYSSSINGSSQTLNDSLDIIFQKSNNFLILDQLNQKQQLRTKQKLELKQQQQEAEDRKLHEKLLEKEKRLQGLNEFNSKIQSHYLLNFNSLNQIDKPILSDRSKYTHNLNPTPTAVPTVFQLQYHQLQRFQQTNDNQYFNNNYNNTNKRNSFSQIESPQTPLPFQANVSTAKTQQPSLNRTTYIFNVGLNIFTYMISFIIFSKT